MEMFEFENSGKTRTGAQRCDHGCILFQSKALSYLQTKRNLRETRTHFSYSNVYDQNQQLQVLVSRRL